MSLIYKLLIIYVLGGGVQTQAWQNATLLETHSLPASFRAWMLDPGSMTVRMEHLCRQVEVHVLTNQDDQMTDEERQYLPSIQGDRAWIREVIMTCDQVPWLFGRTVIPLSGAKASLPELTKLKTTPLGKVLFADPTTTRSGYQFAYLTPDNFYVQRCRQSIQSPSEPLWARRSIFHYQGKPLILTELFLPQMIHALQD
jgi:chorismate--pyruvate lyase